MPVTVTIPARSTQSLGGYGSATVRVPILNSGTVPLRVSGSVESATKLAKQHPAASWVTSISPRSEVIAPHRQGFLTLHIRVPAGNVAGPHFLNLIAHIASVAKAGQVHLAGGVGGTIKLTHAGHKLLPLPPVVSPPVHGTPWLLLIGALVLLGIIAEVGRRAFRSARKRRRVAAYHRARPGQLAAVPARSARHAAK